ncbi:hypothetical protein TRAPUB_2716 [Trametes pubescens]|uniref:C2H2-type domain-containing protein n=1 Tax=Trametes pubescens TaxID=154538 RepID=A0A1M2VFP2_TRAPU|nr:hypothetical protein TRAPUB_2716 [Trametes pubescens]
MAVITATTRIESFERHYFVPPHRPHTGGIRGDTSTPYAYAQKHNAENMEYRHSAKQASSSRHPAERSDATSHPREVARIPGETRLETRYAQRQPPTPPWLQRQSYAPAPSASAPSLSGSMRFNNPTAASGLNGAFSGAWASARPSPAHGLTPTSGAWTQHGESSDSGMDEDESASLRDELRAIHNLSRSSAGVPLRSESDRFLGTPSRSPHQPTRTAAEQRELDASVRLPPIRPHAPPPTSEEHSPYDYDRFLPPAQRVQLPCFQTVLVITRLAPPPPESGRSVVEGSSSSPSRSPSVASVSTNAQSWGQTDTEPTEDEDVAMGEVKRYGSFPPQTLAPDVEIVRPLNAPWQRPTSRPLEREDDSPLPTPLPMDAATRAAPAPETPKPRQPSKGKEREEPAKAKKPRRRATEPKLPPQKKYRFVASHLSGDVRPPPEAMAEDERGRSESVHSGSKRKHTMSPSPAPSSSPDLSLASVVSRSSSRHPSIPAQPMAGPSSRRQSQAQARAHDPPKRRGRPPRPAYDIESVAPIDPDSPEGQGQFPVYSYRDEERPTPCQFPGCEALLTGKKAETTSHLKEHFQKAGNRLLSCPWKKTSGSGECTPCERKFKDSANMGRHVATKHLQSEKYKCGKCHREFARRDAALRHMKTMCSPEKEQRRAAKRKAESDEESEDAANDGESAVLRGAPGSDKKPQKRRRIEEMVPSVA